MGMMYTCPSCGNEYERLGQHRATGEGWGEW
jgi:predicted nucleic-acid-binding Zn-ribbon protein